MLDIYHASSYLYGAAKVLFGDAAEQVAAWVEARRQTLLEAGAAALNAELAQQRAGCRRAARASLQEVIHYFEPHQAHTNYRERLAQGRSIGSGMIEGACKTVVGKRLKQTGARWRVRHAERMVALCGVLYGDHWDRYWQPQAN